MTNVLPIGMAVGGAAVGATVAAPVAITLGGAGLVVGFMSKHAGGGVHLTEDALRDIRESMNVAMAANWAVRPVIAAHEADEEMSILQDMYDAVAGRPLRMRTQQWPILKDHIVRAHISAIPPYTAMKWIKRNLRDRRFGAKRRETAIRLVTIVAQCYAVLHPDPERDYGWYEKWAEHIGFKPIEAKAAWDEVMSTRSEPETDVGTKIDVDSSVPDDVPVAEPERTGESHDPAVLRGPKSVWDLVPKE